jgi:hypothetical protein
MTTQAVLRHPDFTHYVKKRCGKLNINKLTELAAKLNPKTAEDLQPPKRLLAVFGPREGEACAFEYQPLPGNSPRVKLVARSNTGDFKQIIKLATRNYSGRINYSFICSSCGGKVKSLILDCDSDEYVCADCLAEALTFVTLKTKLLQRKRQSIAAY